MQTRDPTQVILIAILIGCNTVSDDVDSRSHVVTDSAGIRIVQSNAPEWATPRVIEPDPVLRIGQQGEGPYLFESPGTLFLDGGRIAVAEAGAGEVRIFDAEGRHLRTFGGIGPPRRAQVHVRHAALLARLHGCV